jgi:hypothetical protein
MELTQKGEALRRYILEHFDSEDVGQPGHIDHEEIAQFLRTEHTENAKDFARWKKAHAGFARPLRQMRFSEFRAAISTLRGDMTEIYAGDEYASSTGGVALPKPQPTQRFYLSPRDASARMQLRLSFANVDWATQADVEQRSGATSRETDTLQPRPTRAYIVPASYRGNIPPTAAEMIQWVKTSDDPMINPQWRNTPAHYFRTVEPTERGSSTVVVSDLPPMDYQVVLRAGHKARKRDAFDNTSLAISGGNIRAHREFGQAYAKTAVTGDEGNAITDISADGSRTPTDRLPNTADRGTYLNSDAYVRYWEGQTATRTFDHLVPGEQYTLRVAVRGIDATDNAIVLENGRERDDRVSLDVSRRGVFHGKKRVSTESQPRNWATSAPSVSSRFLRPLIGNLALMHVNVRRDAPGKMMLHGYVRGGAGKLHDLWIELKRQGKKSHMSLLKQDFSRPGGRKIIRKIRINDTDAARHHLRAYAAEHRDGIPSDKGSHQYVTMTFRARAKTARLILRSAGTAGNCDELRWDDISMQSATGQHLIAAK